MTPHDPLPAIAPEDQWIPAARAAAALGISARTLRAWCAEGHIPGAIRPSGYAGSWYLTVRGLRAVGLLPNDPADSAEAPPHPNTPERMTP